MTFPVLDGAYHLPDDPALLIQLGLSRPDGILERRIRASAPRTCKCSCPVAVTRKRIPIIVHRATTLRKLRDTTGGGSEV